MLPRDNKIPRTQDLKAPLKIGGIVSNSTRKNRTYSGIITFIVFNLIALTAYAFVFGFIMQKKDAVVATVSMLDVEQLKEQQLKVLKDGFRKTEAERKQLYQYFIGSEEVVAFIEDIERMGRHADVSLEFNFVNIRDVGERGVLTMEFKTNGSFEKIFYFLRLIESLPFRISLENFLLDKNISRTAERQRSSDAWRGVFTLTVLSFDAGEKYRSSGQSTEVIPELAAVHEYKRQSRSVFNLY